MSTTKPRTEKQIAASRANGTKSKGPVSPEGKQHSAQNARKHGLAAAIPPTPTTITEPKKLTRPLTAINVFPGESEQEFEEMTYALVQEFRPSTPSQIMLVNDLAVARWRADRASRKMKLNQLRIAQGLEVTESEEVLHRYYISYKRMFSRCLSQLRSLKADEAKLPTTGLGIHDVRYNPPPFTTERTQQPIENAQSAFIEPDPIEALRRQEFFDCLREKPYIPNFDPFAERYRREIADSPCIG